ncbi:hypothetical protein, conserved, partial [Perkinsus marinus ATCC 50983]
TNHSCSPNAEASFRGSRCLRVKSLKPVHSGEEVFQSYIDENLPLVERQSKLRQAYGFACRCGRCRTEALAELNR